VGEKSKLFQNSKCLIRKGPWTVRRVVPGKKKKKRPPRRREREGGKSQGKPRRPKNLGGEKCGGKKTTEKKRVRTKHGRVGKKKQGAKGEKETRSGQLTKL